MDDVKYNKDHYWFIVDGNSATVGLSNHMIDAIEEINRIELPEVESIFDKNDVVGLIETNEDNIELSTPFTGKILEINTNLFEYPDNIRNYSYEDKWLFKITIDNEEEIEDSMSEEEYEALVYEDETNILDEENDESNYYTNL